MQTSFLRIAAYIAAIIVSILEVNAAPLKREVVDESLHRSLPDPAKGAIFKRAGGAIYERRSPVAPAKGVLRFQPRSHEELTDGVVRIPVLGPYWDEYAAVYKTVEHRTLPNSLGVPIIGVGSRSPKDPMASGSGNSAISAIDGVPKFERRSLGDQLYEVEHRSSSDPAGSVVFERHPDNDALGGGSAGHPYDWERVCVGECVCPHCD